MSRRAASFTQADVHRALKAAQQAGPVWQVLIDGSTIRFFQDETKPPVADKIGDERPQEEDAREKEWKL